MRLACSWAMRWKLRSEPERSTRTAISGYFASNAFASRVQTGRSIAEYQTTLPSFFSAAISAGVTGSGGRRGGQDAGRECATGEQRAGAEHAGAFEHLT